MGKEVLTPARVAWFRAEGNGNWWLRRVGEEGGKRGKKKREERTMHVL